MSLLVQNMIELQMLQTITNTDSACGTWSYRWDLMDRI